MNVMSDREEVLRDRAVVVRHLRARATYYRNEAARIGVTDRASASLPNRMAEEIGRLANQIERGEHEKS